MTADELRTERLRTLAALEQLNAHLAERERWLEALYADIASSAWWAKQLKAQVRHLGETRRRLLRKLARLEGPTT